MSEIKYTTDGKKVIVIGNLNSVEKIVQEVFIVDGSEIPSGEHFVVKSLHDAPAVSWKEKNEKDIDKRYNEKKDEFERWESKLRSRQKELTQKFEYLGKVINNVSAESFDQITNLLTGKIKYIVCPDYIPKLMKFEDFEMNNSDGMRLVSLFGRDDGTLNFYLGYYSDHSGGKNRFIPFSNYEDAFEKFASLVKSATVTNEILKLAKEYNIELYRDEVDKWKETELQYCTKNKDDYEVRIAEMQSRILALESI